MVTHEVVLVGLRIHAQKQSLVDLVEYLRGVALACSARSPQHCLPEQGSHQPEVQSSHMCVSVAAELHQHRAQLSCTCLVFIALAKRRKQAEKHVLASQLLVQAF